MRLRIDKQYQFKQKYWSIMHPNSNFGKARRCSRITSALSSKSIFSISFFFRIRKKRGNPQLCLDYHSSLPPSLSLYPLSSKQCEECMYVCLYSFFIEVRKFFQKAIVPLQNKKALSSFYHKKYF